MSKSDILDWFTGNAETLTTERILFVFAVSVAVGIVVFLTYRLAYRGVAYSAKFNVSNVALVLISATIMLMISSNIAISLGMVGALSIVRFRTAIKDPQDTVYIFWAIVEGLCIGALLYKLAVLSSLVIAALLLCGSFYDSVSKKYLIVLRGTSFSQDTVLEILQKHYRKHRVRSANSESLHMEMVCEVTSGKTVSEAFICELKAVEGVHGVDWLLETGGHVG
ncbi:MAG: DUF4956 domain-containing protein [Lachnospiraceae bacterium]|nr:DUF4956 domain-containing protein [Lachnospiraceae bacterium]